jgi:threonyl-tRNA synthetase
VQILDPENSLSKNVRLSETKKVPVKVILGEKEMQNEGVTVRRYGQNEQFEMSLEDFVKQIVLETKV